MEIQLISTPHDRPRCIGADAQGRRYCESVVWNQVTNRPISTRFQMRCGQVDAVLLSQQSLDATDMSDKVGAGTGTANVRANSSKTLRTKGLGRALGILPALVPAGVLCVFMTGPVLAGLESTAAVYDRGDYTKARSEIQSLAANGAQRAQPYLEKFREQLRDDQQAGGSVTPTLKDTVNSMFGESETSGIGSESGATPRDTGSSAARRSPVGASGNKPTDWEPWSPFDQGSEPTPPPVSDVAIPRRRSVWSAVFHLPGDATVIGLQYVAQFLNADNLSRELQIIGRHGDKIAFSILASFWWLVIIRGVVGIGFAIRRFMQAATTTMGQKRYG